MSRDNLVAETRNPEGRLVRLERTTWEHLIRRHSALEKFVDALMVTIERPEYREPDPRPGRERYFRRTGPQRWLRVVTEFAGESDRVVTAFPQTNDPRPPGSRR